MSFQQAKDCFDDIKNHASSDENPIYYDLANGLSELSESLENEFRAIRQELHALKEKVRNP